MKKLYTLGLYEKAMPSSLDWKQKLTLAKNVGYDFVEMSIDATDEKIQRVYMTAEARRNLVDTMLDVGLPIRTMCVSALTKYSIGNGNAELCEKGMEIIEKAIELAADLGIRIVMIPGYDVYYETSTPETKRRFYVNLKKVASLAARHSVLVELETMENDFMNTVWKAMYYVESINSPYLGVYPDTGNLKNASVSMGHCEIQDLKSGEGHITSLHLKETVPGVFREVEYGTGHVDFKEMIEAAWDIGVRKYVTEFWHTGADNWKQEIRNAYDMACHILDAQCEGTQ